MKGFIIAFVICCWKYAEATLVVPEELSSPAIPEGNLSTAIPMIEINRSSSSDWDPPPNFFSGAFSAFTVIVVSELGDKTFFIAVVLALTCSPLCVFAGAISALTVMTLLSAGLGLVTTVIPYFWVQCISALLFLLFGIKMLREGYMMKSTACKEEFQDVQKDVDSKMASKGKVIDAESGTVRTAARWVFLEAFAMTFLAEWGDRSQITTVLLAAKDSIYGVVVGATLGHAACTLLAVLGGRIVSDRISLRVVTLFGALLFFIFAIISIVNAAQEYTDPQPS